MPAGSDSPFGDLIGQVVRAGAAIKGLNATFDGLSKAVSSVATAITGKLLDALGQFAGGIAKATVGLAAIGAAALPGGFKALGEVVDYMTAVIGSLGVPVFVSLAAAALTVTDIFKDALLSAAKAFAGFIVNDLIPGIRGALAALNVGVQKTAGIIEKAQEAFAAHLVWVRKLFGVGVPGEGAALGEDAARRGRERQNAIDQAVMARDAVGGGGGGFGKDFMDKFAENFEKIVKSLQLSLGKAGNVGFAGLTDVWKQVQMQSFVSPIEREKLARWAENIQLLKDMLKELRKDPALAIGK